MTRKEALEYVNNMWMYEDTKNALETLIPEFGKAGKVIDHEDKYKEALLEARAVLEPCLKYSNGKVREALDSIDKELQSFESEDEKIRKLLVWQVHRNIEDETNDLAQSVYDGIKGHDPDIEESIEDWKRCLAWLEKQKERGPQPQGTYKQVIHTIFGMLKDKDFYEIQPSHRVSLLNDIRVKCKDAIECAPILDEPHWKPSEEQMEALKRTIHLSNFGAEENRRKSLSSLYEQLKKL